MAQLLDETDSTPSPASDTVCKFFKCLDTLEVTDRLPQLVTKLSTCSTRYPLLDTLVPAIIDLYNTLTHPDIQQCIKELTAHCISVVTKSLSEPASPPRVFYSMPISCLCTDCSTLSSFLINPNKDEQHRFSLPREKQKHIKDQLKGCPVIKCISQSQLVDLIHMHLLSRRPVTVFAIFIKKHLMHLLLCNLLMMHLLLKRN